MPRTPTTPAQISGHRFLYRRIEHALIRGDSKMLHDPIKSRNRAMAVSVVLMVLLLAGSAIVALIRPRGADSIDADLVMVAETQALHIRVNGRLHPVANLASARLILGRAEQPQKVTAAAVNQWPQGYPIGIAHAPDIPVEPEAAAQAIGAASRPAGDTPPSPAPALGVCESVVTEHDGVSHVAQTLTRVTDTPEAAKTNNQPTMLVEYQGQTWFIADGSRHRFNLADSPMARALGVETARIRPIGPAFLRAIPEGRPLAAPTIEEAGTPTAFPMPFDRVGNIVDVGGRSVVVRTDGAVEISPVVAEILSVQFPRLSAVEAQLAAIPVAAALDSDIPDEKPQWLNDDGWVCADTATAGATNAELHFYSSDEFSDAAAIAYPHADQGGPAVDGFIPAESGGKDDKTGGTIAVSVNGAPHIISAQGTRFSVENLGALNALGFASPVDVHWPTLVAFREGPALTRQSALAAEPQQ